MKELLRKVFVFYALLGFGFYLGYSCQSHHHAVESQAK